MNISDKLSLIRTNLSELIELDRKLDVFGASSHKYQLNEKLREEDVSSFEKKFSITLPEEYRSFLKRIGNGGAGPYYGLQSLEDSLYADLDFKRPGEFVNPSIAFPFQKSWNMEFTGDEEDEDAYEAFQREYFSEKWETGILRVCNYGCGVSLNLVVNGSEKGNIWVDDRGNDGGIYPDPYFEQTGRTSFLDWYLLWIDTSLKELRSEKIT